MMSRCFFALLITFLRRVIMSGGWRPLDPSSCSTCLSLLRPAGGRSKKQQQQQPLVPRTAKRNADRKGRSYFFGGDLFCGVVGGSWRQLDGSPTTALLFASSSSSASESRLQATTAHRRRRSGRSSPFAAVASSTGPSLKIGDLSWWGAADADEVRSTAVVDCLAFRALTLVDQMWAESQRKVVVAIAGAPGSGKSELSLAVCARVRELAAAAHASGAYAPHHCFVAAVVLQQDAFNFTRAQISAAADPSELFKRRGAQTRRSLSPTLLSQRVRKPSSEAAELVATSYLLSQLEPAISSSPAHRRCVRWLLDGRSALHHPRRGVRRRRRHRRTRLPSRHSLLPGL